MKNRGALTLLLAANVVSEFAHGVLMLAIPWYFTDVLQRPDLFGGLFAFVTFLTLFWSLYSGTLIDRYSRKNVFLGITTVGTILIGSIYGIGLSTGGIPVLPLCLGFTLTVFNFNIHYPTLYAFAQEITEKQDYARVNSMIEIQGQATRMIASAIAAFLLAGTKSEDSLIAAWVPFSFDPWPMTRIFGMDALAYAVAFVLILFIRYKPTEQRLIDKGSVWKRVGTGFSFLKANPYIFLFGCSSYMIFVFVIVQAYFMMPVYVEGHLGIQADGYALGEVLFAFGAIWAGLWVRRILRHFGTVKAIALAMFVSVLLFFWCSFTRSLNVLLIFNLLLGFMNSATRVMRVTYLFDTVPNGVIGRANSVFQGFNIIMRTLFTALFSLAFFSDGSNIIRAYMVSGIAIFLFLVPLLLTMGVYKDLKIHDPREQTRDG